MAPAVVHDLSQRQEIASQNFSILDDGPKSCDNQVVAGSDRPVGDSGNAVEQLTVALKELSVGQSQNRAGSGSAPLAANGASTKHSSAEHPSLVDLPEQKSPIAKIGWRAAGKRRATVESDTFEPLDAVLEETSVIAEKEVESTTNQATPLKENEQSSVKMYTPRSEGGVATMTMTEPPPPPYTPLQVPEIVTNIERAVSPALSFTSDRSGLALDRSPRPSLLSLPRIEDSLEELDQLEDDLEAIHQVAYTHRVASAPKEQLSEQAPVTPSATKTSTAAKRASFAGYSSTVRVKPSEKARPSLRRSSSLTLRDKTSAQPQPDITKADNTVSRSQATFNRLSTPRHVTKSTKPVTVPNFELPGEAVARRLKEQREARLAQQAEGQKVKMPTPPKPRQSKPLAKPTFELPGEAISRRKREEREAKLRAEEEEQKKRREFKARPIRHSMGPTTMPRETLASRARQDRVVSGEKANDGTATQRKRMSLGPNALGSSTASLSDKLSLPRGRNSMIVRTSEGSRTTSVSTGSISGKRSSVSAEELVMQKQRGRDVLVKDRSFVQDKERTKREREVAAKTAREQAAERSRIASREWAEKKRRRELAAKQSQQAGGQISTLAVTK